MGRKYAEVPSLGVAAQAKPVLLESAAESALHTLGFGFDPVNANRSQGIGV